MRTALGMVNDAPSYDDRSPQGTAAIYNRAGSTYVAFADGDPTRLFSFDGPHGYADRYLWSVLDAKLVELRATGARSLRVLDAGCGPGTWLRRLVTRAIDLGFTTIVARGFDVADTQVQAARALASDIALAPGVTLMFDVADLTAPLPEANGSVDIALCLYSVLSHLPTTSLPGISAEMARVTKGHFITTVRSVGSTPSIFVDSIEKARSFQFDHVQNRCEIELLDGRRFAMNFHLFTSAELINCFSDRFAIDELRGLDLFHSRFAPDPRWNAASLADDWPCQDDLDVLEEAYSKVPGMMERATHLLLVGHPSCPMDDQ